MLMGLLTIAAGIWLVLQLPAFSAPGLGAQVSAQLASSGVQSPVTAVLLNFRALDTLYEVAVLALAANATLSLKSATALPEAAESAAMLDWLVPRLLPVVLLFAGYLWWAGSSRPGGAFQAGTTVAGLLLLLVLNQRQLSLPLDSRIARAVAMAGPLWFLVVGSATALAGRAFLDYPDAWTKALILSVEAFLTAAIGVTLALLATGGRQES
ncbi:MAG: MnhB domain-containing protein [Thiogranum sp.]|nr:MnhB domain-containing protein [Thiogranum sp.]